MQMDSARYSIQIQRAVRTSDMASAYSQHALKNQSFLSKSSDMASKIVKADFLPIKVDVPQTANQKFALYYLNDANSQ